MISLDKEKRIRRMLKDERTRNLANGDIAKAVGGVTPKAVKMFREMFAKVELTDAGTLKEIRKLLTIGLPVEVISVDTGVCFDVVLAIRRYYYMHVRSATVKKPEVNKHSLRGLPPVISEESATGLWKVATDVVGLYETKTIASTLFHYLAKRAKKVLEKINDEKENE